MKKNQKLDHTRVSRQMDAWLKKKGKSMSLLSAWATAHAMAEDFIEKARKAHPLSDYHAQWLLSMAKSSVARYRVGEQKRKPKKISEEVGETTSLPDQKKCPECGGLWEYFIRGERFSHVVGIEDPNVYDGVSWWRCPHCGATWDRWTGKLMKDWPKK